jgi:RHS repeat-associated protein
VAIRLSCGLQPPQIDVGTRRAHLIGLIGLVFFVMGAFAAPKANADWGGGGVSSHPTAQAQCEAIAQSFTPTAFLRRIYAVFTSSGGGTPKIWAQQCDILWGSEQVGGPVVPVNCPAGTYADAAMFTGCAPENIGYGKGDGACKAPGQATAGNPISVCTGNKFEMVTDYTTAGQNPLAFIRYYNALGESYAPGPPLGTNWRSNYDRYLTILTSPAGAVAERADGQVVGFNVSGGVGTPDSDVDLTLVQSGSNWVLTDSDDTVETYGPPDSTSHCQLLTIKARDGYTQTLSYNSNGQLTTVTDSYNRTLTLAYASGLLTTVTTPDGLVLTYAYNSSGLTSGDDRLVSVSYSTSSATSQTYLYENTSFPFALTGIIDEDDNRFATWTYDGFGRGTSSQYAGGANLTTISYGVDGSGNPVNTVTNALGQQTVYKFAILQSLPKVTEMDRVASSTTAAATRLFTYDTNGYLASQTDWNGVLTNYVNNARGEPTSITEAVGTAQQRVTTTTYLSTFHLPSQIVGPLTTTNFTYDSSGDLLTRSLVDTTTFTVPYPTNGVTRTWTYTWSNFLLASIQGPRGAPNELLQFGYDAGGALTGITNGLGQFTYIPQHTPGGLPLAVVDPNGVTRQLTYDARQRLLTDSIYETSGSLTTTYAYDPVGDRTGVTLPDGAALTYSYDHAHRLTGITDLFNNQIAYTLDALGDRTQTAILNSSSTTTYTNHATFDALGRKLTEIGGAGQTTAFAYDNVGNVLSTRDSLGRVTTQTFDALNRLTTITQPNSAVTTLAYDAGDKINSVTDPSSNQTTYVNDGFGDRIQEVSPDRGTTVYHYDLGANLTQRVDAASTVTNHTYDALDRILTTTYPGGSAEDVAYTYDAGCGCNSIGRLSSLTDAVGSLTFAYNRRGLVIQTTRTNGSAVLTTAYSYDPASRIASITYPSGLAATYGRDAMGRITSVGAVNPNISLSASVVSGIAYEPFGSPTALTYGNGIAETRSYDLDYRETGLTAVLSGTPVQSLAYAYDPNDNVSTIADSVTSANSQAFGYDVLNRLVTAAGGYSLTAASQSYAYTSGTNQLSTVTDGSTTVHQFAYSATGNVTQDNRAGTVFNIGYNQADRLATVQQGTSPVASYGYDAFGQRLLKSLPGSPATITLYQYDQFGHQIEDSDISTGSPSPHADYIYLGDQPIGLVLGSALYYYHDDRLGTPQLATNGSGAVQWSGNYEPFGGVSISGSITQNLRLPGQYADAETGWYNNGFRTYASDIGRYIEADPAGVRAGTNTYAYVRNNPVRWLDPEGLIPIMTPPLPNSSGNSNLECFSTPGTQNTNPDYQPVRFDPDQEALIDLLQQLRRGITLGDANTLLDWADEYGLSGRIDPRHGTSSMGPHLHLGPISHVPIKP